MLRLRSILVSIMVIIESIEIIKGGEMSPIDRELQYI